MIAAGVWVTLAICVAMALWIAFTWDRGNRPVIAALLGAAIVGATVVALLPHERIVHSRWRERFFLTWSALDIAVIAVVAALDGGAGSPAALVFFLTVIFAALSYPLRSVVIVSALNLGAFLVLATIGGRPGELDGSYLWVFASTLTLASAMCLWHARIHNDQRRRLAEVSRTDPLTGCLNRRGIEEQLDQEIERATREDLGFGLVVVDLDHFKAVNDRFGHAAGDDVLCWTVEAVRGLLRAQDSLGRLGGDEFAVLLPGVEQEGLPAVARRLRERLAERVAVTTGVAFFPVDGETRDDLHRRADADLYAAKRARSDQELAVPQDRPAVDLDGRA